MQHAKDRGIYCLYIPSSPVLRCYARLLADVFAALRTPTMASSIFFILILSLLRSTAWAQIQLSPEAAEAALHLPPCVSKCGLDILPQFNCTIGEDCYCARTGPLEDALASCVIGGCPSLGDALAGLKFQALSCNYRTDRNITPLMFRIVVAMFSVATFFAIARFVSRWPRLRGAGLSWDDGKYRCRRELESLQKLMGSQALSYSVFYL